MHLLSEKLGPLGADDARDQLDSAELGKWSLQKRYVRKALETCVGALGSALCGSGPGRGGVFGGKREGLGHGKAAV